MKIAFAVDFLVERTPEVYLLELLLAGFEEAEIYCLAHLPGKILGRIEHHRIHSSPLSRLVMKPSDLSQHAWLLPSVVKQLRVAHDVEKLIILSSGWAHLIASGPETERFVWLYQFAPRELALHGLKKIFSYHHDSLKRQSLLREKQLAFSAMAVAHEVKSGDVKIIYPGYKTEEHPIVPDEQHSGEYPYHLVLLKGAPVTEVRAIFKAASLAGVAVKCLGPDELYESEKGQHDPALEFIGDHCAATRAAITHAARAVWILGASGFPSEALSTLASGRPAVVRDNPINREFLPVESVWFLSSTVAELFEQVNRDYLSPDKKTLRRQGLKYNERLFKNQLRAWSGLKALKSDS